MLTNVDIQNPISVSFSQTAWGVFSEWHDRRDWRFHRSCHVCALKNGGFQPNLEGGTTVATGTTKKSRVGRRFASAPAVRSPCFHQGATLFQQVTPPVSGFNFVLNGMRKGHFCHIA